MSDKDLSPEHVERVASKTRKVVVNVTGGHFDLSLRALARLAQLQGRPCYFFERFTGADTFTPIDVTKPRKVHREVYYAFDIPNPNEVLESQLRFQSLTLRERQESNELYRKHEIGADIGSNREDPHLVQVVEELGPAASGPYAKLRIIEIPADVEYVIETDDTSEWIAERHRAWRYEGD